LNLYSRGRDLKIASFEGPMILRESSKIHDHNRQRFGDTSKVAAKALDGLPKENFLKG